MKNRDQLIIDEIELINAHNPVYMLVSKLVDKGAPITVDNILDVNMTEEDVYFDGDISKVIDIKGGLVSTIYTWEIQDEE